MPNGFHSSGELNPGAATTLNSKRGQAFSSTAIEHYPHASSEGRPKYVKRFRIKRKEHFPSDAQTACVDTVRDECVYGVLYLSAPVGRPPSDREQLGAQLGTHFDEGRQELEPQAIAKVVERAVRRVLHELDSVLLGVGSDLRPVDAEQWPHEAA
jgi:hypothetical protein